MAGSAPKPFLTACWRNLLVVTYAVPDKVVAGLVPAGVELDHLDGRARVSMVAFEFDRTRVYGLPIPRHVRFPEINLRFYVRGGDDRGIVFIREFVPRRAVSLVARARYNEPYRTLSMHCTAELVGDRMRVNHVFGRPPSRISAEADRHGVPPAVESAEYWLTHHLFGFGQTRRGEGRKYRVEHPVWPLHAVRSLELDVDFAALYGPEWAFLGETEPGHVTFAAGSEVAVYPPDPDA